MRSSVKSTSSIVCLLLVICILAPSVTKIIHGVYYHQHLECENSNTLHVHKAELDCDFQKCYPSPNFTGAILVIGEYLPVIIQQHNLGQYSFLNKYQKLHFVLRGPPYLS